MEKKRGERTDPVREVLKSAAFVAKTSTSVSMDTAAIDAACDRLSNLSLPTWPDWCHFFDGGERSLAYLLILDSINFCFWAPSGEPRWEIQTPSGGISGYYALALRIKQIIEEGIPFTDPYFLADIDQRVLRDIIGGNGVLQLMPERASILRETGSVLIEYFGGKASELLRASKGSAVGLVELLYELFPSFRDTAELQGDKLFFLKRAQLLASDIHGAFRGSGWGELNDMEALTAFADYKLPQVLRELGVLSYDQALAETVDSLRLLNPGSREELEIRANTIIAVEALKQGLFMRGRRLNSYHIDGLLWNLGQSEDFRKRPYHRTVTIYY